MKIQKFGTGALATADKIKTAVDIVQKERGNLVVLSSMKGTAEALTEISDYLYKKNQEGANEIINKLELTYLSLLSTLFSTEEFGKKALELVRSKFDYIRTFTKDLFTLFEERAVLAQGEVIISEIFNLILLEKGLKTTWLYAPDFIRTDKNAVPDVSYIKDRLNQLLSTEQESDVYITQGYICRNAYGEIDDLRKGGSDLSACLVGVAVDASEIQIWADIDVMQNNDSRYVKGTKVVRHLNFEEAAELTYFGAKILHPSSILPAKMANIPVRLMNTNFCDPEGTLISNETEHSTIKAVAAKDGITAIKIKSGRMLLAHGFLRRVFEVFENYQTPIDMLASSEVGISMTIDTVRNLEHIVDDLKKYGTVSVDRGMAIVGIIGDLNWSNAGFQSRILEAVKDIPVRMISYGGSNYNVSFLIKKEDKERALQLLDEKLFK